MTTKNTKRYLAAAALLGGGVVVGAVASPIGLAGAQSSDDDAPTTDAPAAGESTDGEGRRGHRHGRAHGHRAEVGDVLSELTGLSTDELRAAASDGQTLAEIAEANGVSREELTAGLLAAAEEHLDEKVAEGDIDAEIAAERLAELGDRIDEMIDRTPSDHPGRGHGRGHGVRHGLRHQAADVLDQLGITSDEVRAGFADGKTLADIAAEQGVAEEALVDALVAAANERVDEALDNGRIDEEKAAEIKDSLDERISEMIDAAPGDRAGHRHRHGGPFGDADGPVDADTDGPVDDGETVESSSTA